MYKLYVLFFLIIYIFFQQRFIKLLKLHVIKHKI